MEQMLITSKHFLKELVVCLAMLQVAGLLFYMLIPKQILKSFRLILKNSQWLALKLSKGIKYIFSQAKSACVHLITKCKKKKQLSYGRKKVANSKVINLSKYKKAK